MTFDVLDRWLPLALFAFMSACTPPAATSRDPVAKAPAVPSSPLVASATAPPAPPLPTADAPTPADPWPAALGVPTMPAPGTISVDGYPTRITKCLPDPADHAGFTPDGEEFGYCSHGMSWRCELVGRDGKRRSETSAATSDSPAEDPAKARTLETWMGAHLPALAVGNCTVTPARLAGTWDYPDITLHVSTVGGIVDGDRVRSQPFVRIGGSVGGAGAVFPVTESAPHIPLSAPAAGEIAYHVAELNELALSPDGKELGWVVHSYCGEWCDDFRVVRTTTAHFAALVYNDTGYAAYRGGDLAKAADLFARAAYVDRLAELPAYNLACAYARLGDARARPALETAIARGGARVRERARKDADLAGVRTADWFERLTGPGDAR